MNSVEFLVTRPMGQIQQTLAAGLAQRGYRLTVHSPASATAEKGSKVGNFFGGAFAQYFAYHLALAPTPRGCQVVLARGNSGWMGGIIGAHRVKKEFEALSTSLETYFTSARILAGKRIA